MSARLLRAASLPRLAVLLALFAPLLASPASAQNTRRPRRESNQARQARISRTIADTYSHRFEAAGGGGYERFRSGPYEQQDNQVTFWASNLYALSDKFGILGEVRGAYGKAKIGNLLPSGNVLTFKPQISEYNFMAGPSFRFVRLLKYSASGFVEAGLGLGKFDGDSKGLTSADIGVWNSGLSPAFAAGINFDYNLSPAFAVRVTPTYLGTLYGSSPYNSSQTSTTLQNSKGLNFGVVYRFGRQR